MTAQTSLDLAQSQVEQVRKLLLEAEKDLQESRAEDSPRIETSAVLPEGDEEEEIPEAYLRED